MAPTCALSAADWESHLAAFLGRPVTVRYGRARTCVVRARRTRPGEHLEVQLNAMFADAPPPVRDALCAWLSAGRRARKACGVLDAWIETRLERLHREQPRNLRVTTRGRRHDLEALAEPLLQQEFAGAFEAHGGPPRITWGRAAPSRSRHSLRLGSYDYAARVVRVHRVLDQERVPAWFVRYVLFHELLHAALEEPRRAGRRVLHGPRFRERERQYADFERAKRWELSHLDELIRAARNPRSVRQAPAKAARSVVGWAQELLFR